MAGDPPILELEQLTVSFGTDGDLRTVVDGVSLAVGEGERVGLVGESGSGKSLTLLAALGLVPAPGRAGGRVTVGGVDMLAAPDAELRHVRGGVAGWIPQEPAASFDPTWTVGFQIAEVVRAHRRTGRREARNIAAGLLAEVGLEPPAAFAAAWPHQLSGGQAQRAALAIALAGEPAILLADEPTTALDLLTQADLLRLLETAHRDRRMALLLVSHDLEVVAAATDRLAVMFAGRVVEEGPAPELLSEPGHPYTRELVAAARLSGGRGVIATHAADGCRYAPRCDLAEPSCRLAEPPLAPSAPGRSVRCPIVLSGSGGAGG